MTTHPHPLARLHLPGGTLLDATGDGPWHEPLLWYADRPARPGDWARLYEAGRPLGLLPVLMETGRGDDGPQDWELQPGRTSDPGDHDAEQVLEEYWQDFRFAEEGLEELNRWPGTAPAPAAAPGGLSPDRLAAETADIISDSGRLALIPALRSADIPAAIGWSGPLNHDNDVARLCAVLRSWEDRFGIRVVSLGFDTMKVSVGRPPGTGAEAYALAAEHLAFCPDAIDAELPEGLRMYADMELLGQDVWSFWWD
ncbi:DUF4253 domain-containing protein [Streptomyces nitrosporeus]|uniref:DUF4253 domain-containing protein n=1 Tax=Streptomyces nitrosporeus TaxID=28894 RepID=A0A5J6FFY9_9ACTN|nr:DUF4253 domain-containing protein [Streptomyces nitrosporeus]QEU73865.1 DUF4253 domain-containing protein [Streptomyces nitrosporeus]